MFLYFLVQWFYICRFKQFYRGKHSELDTCSYELSFSQWPTSPPKILTFPPEAPCTQKLSLVFQLNGRHMWMGQNTKKQIQISSQWYSLILNSFQTHKGARIEPCNLELAARSLAGPPKIRSSIPGRRKVPESRPALRTIQPRIQYLRWMFSQSQSGRSIKQTIHLKPVPRIRTRFHGVRWTKHRDNSALRSSRKFRLMIDYQLYLKYPCKKSSSAQMACWKRL